VSLDLKPIHHESVGRAIEKAERYRLLNEPCLAESICLDVLAIEPDHPQALVIYALALSDQFKDGQDGGFRRALDAVGRLGGEYERLYYGGIVHERRGHACLHTGGPGARAAAWHYLTDAMALYEKADAIHAAGNEDAILRWNTCVRLVQRHRLEAPPDDRHDYPLE